jgi:hypothetical protein
MMARSVADGTVLICFIFVASTLFGTREGFICGVNSIR